MKGKCTKGSQCDFAHPPKCRWNDQGTCKKGTSCPFLHDDVACAATDSSTLTDRPSTPRPKGKAKAKAAVAMINQHVGDKSKRTLNALQTVCESKRSQRMLNVLPTVNDIDRYRDKSKRTLNALQTKNNCDQPLLNQNEHLDSEHCELGEIIHSVAVLLYPDVAGKITGMLLELSLNELYRMTQNQTILLNAIEEAATVLALDDARPFIWKEMGPRRKLSPLEQ